MLIFFGARTVEFTDYSDKFLKISNNQSINPIFISDFINNDRERFRKLVKESVFSVLKRKRPEYIEDTTKDSSIQVFLNTIL